MADKRKSSRSSTARKRRGAANRTVRSSKTVSADSQEWRFLKLPRRAWVWLGSFSLTLSIIGLLFIGWMFVELPPLDKLESYEKPPGIRVYDASKNLIGSYGHVVGRYIAYDELPRQLVDALVATEDRRFFEHSGIDPLGIIRAMYHNAIAGGVVQGGSTITQQLAKNAFLTADRTIKRKVQEVMLSLWIESHFSKEKILEIYMNRVYLGAGNYGVDAAAYHYFGKSATELTLQESAMIVGLLKAPSRYAPTRDRKLALSRTKQVILNMKDAEMLNDNAASEAIGGFAKQIHLKAETGNGSRYFADWVVDSLPQYIGQVEGDLEVYTTLDSKLQAAAEQQVVSQMEKEGFKRKASQASLLSMTPDGAIKAMVGGLDYNKSQFNRVTQGKRQPGSSFKLFVYLAALDAGMTPNSYVEDKEVRYGSWSPKNYSGRYMGGMALRDAFARSINSVAVQLVAFAGVNRVIAMAKALGVDEPLEPNLSIALGTSEVSMVEMVTAFAHMANEGRKVKAYGIRKIISGKDNKTVYEHKGEVDGTQVLRTNLVNMMNTLMVGTVERGTGTAARFGRPAAGKTGTTQNSRDAWFIGFTPQYVTGVWVGNDDYTPTNKITGGMIPAAIWRQYMQIAHQGKPVLPIPQGFSYEGGDAYSAGGDLPWLQEGEASQPTGPAMPWDRLRRRYSFGDNPTPAPSPAPANSNEAPAVVEPLTQQLEKAGEWMSDAIESGAEEVEYDYPSDRRRSHRSDQ